jgi:hypothetical protein
VRVIRRESDLVEFLERIVGNGAEDMLLMASPKPIEIWADR